MWTYSNGKAGTVSGDAPDTNGRAQAYVDRVLPGMAAARTLTAAWALVAAGKPADALALLESYKEAAS